MSDLRASTERANRIIDETHTAADVPPAWRRLMQPEHAPEWHNPLLDIVQILAAVNPVYHRIILAAAAESCGWRLAPP